MFSNSIKKLRI